MRLSDKQKNCKDNDGNENDEDGFHIGFLKVIEYEQKT
jgi:hypothetical protein